MWQGLIDILQAGLFVSAQLCGGNMGWGIVLLTLIVRLAMLPLTLSMAKRALERQRKLAALQPEMEQLRKRYKDKPEQLLSATATLYKQHGLTITDLPSTLGMLARLPIMAGFYVAIRKTLAAGISGRFFWITDICRPDMVLAIAVSALSCWLGYLNPQASQQSRQFATIAQGLLALFIVARLAAGIGLYWGTSALVDVLQGVLLQQQRQEKGGRC